MNLARQTDGLVIFADGSDNPGGGAPCDGTVALKAMIDADFQGGLVGLLYDPETVRKAKAAGVGGRFQAALGGKTDNLHGPTLLVETEVVTLSNGHFTYGGPMAKGLEDTLGDAVLLRVGGVEILTNSIRRQLIDRAMFQTVNLDPSTKKLLALKSAVHFRADIGPLAKIILDGDTPGIHRPDFSCFNYKNVRRPVYPLDPVEACGNR
jgi:microcystin degradation protein MlrC